MNPFQTRREFLTTTLKGAGLLAASAFVPSFLARTALAAGADKDATILVVLQLSGGNDGLNTVVPFTDDLYFKARPTIGLKSRSLLKINDQIALNAALRPLKSEFDKGRFAIIQNTGYPNPNRSHFRSMEIWHTGTDDPMPTSGWLGRYFDAQCSGSDPHNKPGEIGVSLGKVMPLSFRNRSNVALSLDDPETFQWNASGETIALAKAQEAIFAKLNRPGEKHGVPMTPLAVESSRMGNLGGINGREPETVNFLRHTAMNAVVAGDRIRTLLGKEKSRAEYPYSRLGQELSMISKLIAGDFPTRVYYASQGGFDTHAGQVDSHARLLGDMAGSLAAFMADLRAHKTSQRVLVLAFSEFGRRVAENGSAGTDHGAAAPMFLLGDAVKGGLHGGPPDLKNLIDGDLRHQTDFRQVYASVLEKWLKTNSTSVLQGDFAPIDVLT